MKALEKAITHNLNGLQNRIAAAAQRSRRRATDVRLIAVTKSVPMEANTILAKLGVHEFGENRLAVAAEKIKDYSGTPVQWHMIGNLQRRQLKDICALFDTVDAVDRIVVAEAISKHCAALEKTMPILLEVNVSGEDTKHGFAPEELPVALEAIRKLTNVRVDGLMTMAPFEADSEDTRPVFAGLRTLAQAHNLKELSMGMTNDFEVAVEEGATQVRIGSALFA